MKEGRLIFPRTLVVGSLNVRGCGTIESKSCEIGCMLGRRGMDVMALCGGWMYWLCVRQR